MKKNHVTRKLCIVIGAAFLIFSFLIVPKTQAQVYHQFTTTNTTTLAGASIYTICEKQSGEIYFGTEKGIAILNNDQTWSYVHDLAGVELGHVAKIKKDNNNKLWILLFYQSKILKENGAGWDVLQLTGMPYGASDVAFDSNGDAWLVNPIGPEIVKLNIAGNYTHYSTAAQFSFGDYISSIAITSNNNIWVGTENQGLLQFDNTNWYSYKDTLGFNADEIRSLYADGNEVWMAALNQSNDFYSITNLAVSTFTTYSVGYAVPSCIAKNTSNQFYFGHSYGYHTFDGASWANIHYGNTPTFSVQNVTSVLPLASGDVWIGARAGGVYKENAGNYTHYETSNGLKNGYSTCVTIDNDNKKLFGGLIGADVYNGNTWDSYGITEGFATQVLSMEILNDNRVIVGLEDDNGLKIFNGTSSSVLLNNKTATALTKDTATGFVWGTLAYSGNSIFKYDGTTLTTYSCPTASSGYFDAITVGNNEEIYVSNNWSGEVYKFNSVANTWTLYNATNTGIPAFDEGIKALAFNRITNELWVGIYLGGGLAKYNGTAWTFYDETSAFGEDNAMALCFDADNNLWIAGYSSLKKFDGSNFISYNSVLSGYDVAWQIKADAENNIWFATNNGPAVLFKGLNSDASLLNLTSSVGTLSPSFVSSITNYTVVLPFGASGAATVTPTLATTLSSITSNIGASNVAGTSPANQAVVIVTAQSGATSTYTVTYSVATSIDEFSDVANISIFPNPSNGLLTVASNTALIAIEITNALGDKVFENTNANNQLEIDLSTQAKGIYFVKINSQQGNYIKKIVLQ